MKIKDKLLWAIDTIRDKLMFGRDELGASLARESRAKGVMIEAISEIEKLEKKLQEATGCLALYLEAEDMIAKRSCDNGTVDFLKRMESK
jgi:hypothetical protein